jgi:hypothetical protein
MKIELRPNVYAGIDRSKSHHPVGIQQSNNRQSNKNIKICIVCNKAIKSTTISIRENEFFHPSCYYYKGGKYIKNNN